jgi:hypothetical protein
MKRVAIIVLVLLAFVIQLPDNGRASSNPDDRKKKKEKIKLVVSCELKNGMAPLTVQVVAQIEASKELDQYIYESSSEWQVFGSFVLTSMYTGGNSTPRNMGQTSQSETDRFLFSQKHLVGKQRKRAPRKKYKEGMEVVRNLVFDTTLEKAGTYYISFKLRRGKYSSNVIVINVKGDTTFDPMRDPH